jgi:hypothetical protein
MSDSITTTFLPWQLNVQSAITKQIVSNHADVFFARNRLIDPFIFPPLLFPGFLDPAILLGFLGEISLQGSEQDRDQLQKRFNH